MTIKICLHDRNLQWIGNVRTSIGRAVVALALVLTLSLVGQSTSIAQEPAEGVVTMRAAPDSFADLVEKLSPIVVNISAPQAQPSGSPERQPNLPPESPFREFFEEFFGQQGPKQSERQRVTRGSAFVIDTTGILVTNEHVIRDAEEITVTFSSGESYTAEVIGHDAVEDIALLKIDPEHKLVAAEFGNSDELRVGDWVIAIGNPWGLAGSVTAGIVSARNRFVNAGPYDDFIQTDASINRGNSGGPLFNMLGQVVGVNTRIFSPGGIGNIGIGFAVPANRVQRLIGHLTTSGKIERGWIGVNIQPVSVEVAESLGFEEARGVIISSVNDDGPADQAGIEPGDILLAFDGEEIENTRQLVRLVGDTPPNKEVSITLWRAGNVLDVDLTTATRVFEGEPEEPQEPAEPEERGDMFLDMRLDSLLQDDRERYEIPDSVEGVLVKNLRTRSDAARRGVRPGDVIVQVNQTIVDTLDKLKNEVEQAREVGRRTVLLRIYRGGGYALIPISIEEPAEAPD
jgi:serine protease Do